MKYCGSLICRQLYSIEGQFMGSYDAPMTALPDSRILLIVGPPTSGAAARMRIWRAIKTLGCVALRDGRCYTADAHKGEDHDL